ncbi:sel1 repeat family protein [Puniceicoccaceae bacterium K14]|nr:sel1 repeat family protein [Puniceicoccaceae bacterium K14]
MAENYDEAIRLYRLAAEQGLSHAQEALGSLYYHGKGVEKDLEEGCKWYKLAAKQGLARAQNSLGLAYYNGKGVEQDNAMAVAWWTIAYKSGDRTYLGNKMQLERELKSHEFLIVDEFVDEWEAKAE